MKNVTLLVLEDSFNMNQFLNNYFSKHFNVVCKDNGAEAIEWIEKNKKVDVILCDINMPGFNGYQFIEYIRNTEFHQQVPILVLSANDTSGDRIKAFKLGANDYVIKPFNPEELLLRIERLLWQKLD